MTYLAALGVDMEKADMLLALDIIQAEVIGEITKEGFVNGWKAVG